MSSPLRHPSQLRLTAGPGARPVPGPALRAGLVMNRAKVARDVGADGESAASLPVADSLPPYSQDDDNDDHDDNDCPDSDIQGVIPLIAGVKILLELPLA